MKLEEFVEDGTVVIRAEVPGIDPDKDVDITVENGMLHLSATREEHSEEEVAAAEHAEILRALLSRDADAAAALVVEHIRGTRARLAHSLSGDRKGLAARGVSIVGAGGATGAANDRGR